MPSYLLAGAERTAFTVSMSLARIAGDRLSIGRLFRPYPKVTTTPPLSASNKGTLDAEILCALQKSSQRSRSGVTAWLPIQAPADRDAAGCAEDRPPRTARQSFLSRALAGLHAPLA